MSRVLWPKDQLKSRYAKEIRVEREGKPKWNEGTVQLRYRMPTCRCLQTALDEVHMVLARPVGVGPDLAEGFPDVATTEISTMTKEPKTLLCGSHLPNINNFQTVNDFLWDIADILAVVLRQ